MSSRAAVLAELHARPFVPMETPRRVYHFAFATNEDEARADREEIEKLCASPECAAAGDAKFKSMTVGDWALRWEQHTEFTTYTWSTSLDAAAPFSHPDPLGAGEIRFRPAGRLIVAAHLCVVGREQSVEELASRFDSRSLCVIGVAKGAAHRADGFRRGRGQIHAAGHPIRRRERAGGGPHRPARAGGRNIPRHGAARPAGGAAGESRSCAPWSTRLSGITHALSHMRDARTNEDLLKRLSDLLAASEALSTRAAFRFGASRAYHALVKNRLDLLQEAKESQYVTISNFFSARLDPAIETCNAVEARQARLSNQLERAINLMRTGITFELERQNRDLLHDMNRRARLQMRLQRIVQGLSVAALAYYLLGLTAFVAKGAKDAGWLPAGVTAEEMTALSVPLVFPGLLAIHGARAAAVAEGGQGRAGGLAASTLGLRAGLPAMHQNKRGEDGESDGHDGDQQGRPIEPGDEGHAKREHDADDADAPCSKLSARGECSQRQQGQHHQRAGVGVHHALHIRHICELHGDEHRAPVKSLHNDEARQHGLRVRFARSCPYAHGGEHRNEYLPIGHHGAARHARDGDPDNGEYQHDDIRPVAREKASRAEFRSSAAFISGSPSVIA